MDGDFFQCAQLLIYLITGLFSQNKPMYGIRVCITSNIAGS